MVAVPTGQQAVHSVAGAGANAASAFILPTVSARGATDAQMTKWRIAFQNLCALQGLGVVVQEGKPPQRDAVKKTWPDLEGPAVEQKFNECLTEYQRENTVLYYYVYSSLNFEGDWEGHDLDYTSRVFVSCDLRDGNGLLKWLELRRLPQILLVLVRRTIKLTQKNSSHFTPRELAALFTQKIFETAEHSCCSRRSGFRARPARPSLQNSAVGTRLACGRRAW